MKKVKIIFNVMLLCFLFSSCSSQEAMKPFPYGNFSYRSYDIAGNLIGNGSIYINDADSGRIEGNWSIRNVHNCTECGSQFGSGYLTGFINEDSIFINLNPDNPDSFTQLLGKLGKETISGEWQWYNLIVASNRGTFEAKK